MSAFELVRRIVFAAPSSFTSQMPPHPMHDDTGSNTRHRSRNTKSVGPQQTPEDIFSSRLFIPEYSQTLLEMDAAKTLISPPPEDSIRPSGSRQSVRHAQLLSSWHTLNLTFLRRLDIALSRAWTRMSTLPRWPHLHMAALHLGLESGNDSTSTLLIPPSPPVDLPAIPIYQI